MEVVAVAGARWCGAAGGSGLLRRVTNAGHEGFASLSGSLMEVFWQRNDGGRRRRDEEVMEVVLGYGR